MSGGATVLIVYASKYGAAARCARELAERIGAAARLASLRGPDAMPEAELSRAVAEAAAVVVGGSIYAGRIRAEVPRFCERRRGELLGRKVALFISCLETGERAREELEAAFPPWLLAHAAARAPLGGEVRVSALRPLDRFLYTRVAGGREDVSRIDREAIASLAASVAGLIGG